MAFSFDIDIYNWLLVDILQLNSGQISGDPVNDAIYLVLLPMVVLYLFLDKVVGGSRFVGKKVEVIIMFIMGFFIVREGYYSIFASFSLPLLVSIMLWHTLAFVFGKENKGGSPDATLPKSQSQPGSGFDDYGGRSSFLNKIVRPLTKNMSEATQGISFATWSKSNFKEEAQVLSNKWENEEKLLHGGTSVFGNQNDSARNALAQQEIIEEELVNLARGARSKGYSIEEIIPKGDLRERIKSRVSVLGQA